MIIIRTQTEKKSVAHSSVYTANRVMAQFLLLFQMSLLIITLLIFLALNMIIYFSYPEIFSSFLRNICTQLKIASVSIHGFGMRFGICSYSIPKRQKQAFLSTLSHKSMARAGMPVWGSPGSAGGLCGLMVSWLYMRDMSHVLVVLPKFITQLFQPIKWVKEQKKSTGVYHYWASPLQKEATGLRKKYLSRILWLFSLCTCLD